MKKEAFKRLHKAMSQIKPIIKDKKNPHFKNTYADINAMIEVVKPILLENNLVLLQPIIQGNVCTQIYDVESGEMLLESSLEMTSGLNAQQKGSEITYFRRYTLQSLLSLEAEDDDGTSASAAPAAPTQELPWLNLFDNKGKALQAYTDLEAFINSGKKTSLSTLKQKFKISKDTEKQLKEKLNIL
jgi:hypothetical protein